MCSGGNLLERQISDVFDHLKTILNAVGGCAKN